MIRNRLATPSPRNPGQARNPGRATRAVLLAAIVATVGPAHRLIADEVVSNFSVDLGSNLDRVGGGRWDYNLGTSWNENFSIGGMIGSQNTTIFPSILGLPPVVADTRTGARFNGNVYGSTGLNLYADFQASGLDTGAAFDFSPSIVNLPSTVEASRFVRLQTQAGIRDTGAFTEAMIDLVSFEAGADFYFNLGLNSKVEAGLFPIIPYTSANLNIAPINVNQSLIKFGFDLDPDSNGGLGTAPSLTILEGTPFEDTIGDLGNGGYLAEKQFSAIIDRGGGFTSRIDIGSGAIVNPFGDDPDLAGSNRNLKIHTSVDADAVRFSSESDLIRLGLDLDGIASFALVGDSVTRLDTDFGPEINGTPLAGITADLIDIKYGPELGFRESVEIRPDFGVTLSFDQEVAIQTPSGVILTDSYQALWGELPGIAVLGEETVNVDVSFDTLTGEQSKRTVMYLRDYMEITLLELEELRVLEVSLGGLPPLLRERFSLLGNLLGEIELEIADVTQQIAAIELASGLGGSFQLTPTVSERLYLAADTGTVTFDPADYRKLADHTQPTGLNGKTLILGVGEVGDQLPSDLDPVTVTLDATSAGQQSLRAIEVPVGTSVAQIGNLFVELDRFTNDGLYVSEGLTDFESETRVALDGTGITEVNEVMRVRAPFIENGPDHTLKWGVADVLTGFRHYLSGQEIRNAGTIVSEGNSTIFATDIFKNTGKVEVIDNSILLRVAKLQNDGQVVVGTGTKAAGIYAENFNGDTQTVLQSTDASGSFVVNNGGFIEFEDVTVFDTYTDPSPDSSIAPLTFDVKDGGRLTFADRLVADGRSHVKLNIEEGSTLELNGLSFDTPDAVVVLANRGTVNVASGRNYFYHFPNIGSGPVDEQPFVSGINIENTGMVRIQADATLGFEAEIKNYAEGGATLGEGAWELIGGTPAAGTRFSNTGDSGLYSGVARLDIDIAKISNGDAYLGGIDFGDTDGDGVPDGYDAADYDTFLRASEANILLSGKASFNYLNTISENRGSLTLRNRNEFQTAGALLNSGQILVESGSRLVVAGDLTVDEGELFVDAASTWSVGANTIEVVGGRVHVDKPNTAFTVGSDWIVREKWVGVDENGADIVLPSVVDYGAGATWRSLAPSANIVVDGELAEIVPLRGLEENSGSLTLSGGTELTLSDSPIRPRLTNHVGGEMRIETGGKLVVPGETYNYGNVHIGREGYVEQTGSHTVFGSTQVDGVLAGDLVAQSGSNVTGSGRITGFLNNTGTVSPGGVEETGTLSVGGQYRQTSTTATLRFDLSGTVAGESHDQLAVEGAAILDGVLELQLADGYTPTYGDRFDLITYGSRDGTFNQLRGVLLSRDLALAVLYGANAISATAALPGDANLDGTVSLADFLVLRANFGADSGHFTTGDFDQNGTVSLADFLLLRANFGTSSTYNAPDAAMMDTWLATVPEPTSLATLSLGGLVLLRRGYRSRC